MGKADEHAKAAAEGGEPGGAVPDEYVGDQPVAHYASGRRGLIPLECPVDHGPRRPPEKVQAPSREGRKSKTPLSSSKVSG